MDVRLQKLRRQLLGPLVKIHRAEASLNFLTICKNENLMPKFTRISNELIKLTSWSPNTIKQKRLECIDNAIIEQNERIYKNQQKISFLIKSSNLSQFTVSNVINTCKTHVTHIERKNDTIRFRKINQLRKFSNQSSAEIEIFNFSDKKIPDDIIKILKTGLTQGTGGSPNKTSLLLEFEKLIDKLQNTANAIKLNPMNFFELKSLIMGQFVPLKNCYTKNDNSKLKKFLDSDPTITIVKVDKSSNLAILNTIDYINKLNDQFSDESKFTRLFCDPFDNDLTKLNACIKTLEPYLTKKEKYKIQPTRNLKMAYGLLKLHKQDSQDLRLIISSTNSLTSGCESYLQPILDKLRPIINRHTLNSTKSFKEFFLSSRHLFNHGIVSSLDVKSLFPSIDIEIVINFIIDNIYKKPRDFFPVKFNEDGNLLYFPPKDVFENFLRQILLEFTSFTTKEGKYFKQKSGIAMGSKLSSILADIFMFVIEKDIVKKYEKNGKLLTYRRYVDDILIFTKDEESVLEIFEKFNSVHKNLKFTLEKNNNNTLAFLDVFIYFDEKSQQFEFNFFQKEIKNDKLDNFISSISPKSQKIGTLCGEIYRANNCSSNEKNLARALKRIEDKFIKNSYPIKLIKSKIAEIKNRNFNKKIKSDDDSDNSPDSNMYYTLSIQYTSHRVEKICKNIRKIIKFFIPDFNLNIVYRKINLENIIIPRMKMKRNKTEKSNIIYSWTCPGCKDAQYIGETKRPLIKRIREHSYSQKTSNIKLHTDNCLKYKTLLNETIDEPDTGKKSRLYNKSKMEFDQNYFEILSSSLTNYHNRSITEAILIKLHNPQLNDQILSRKTVII